MRVGFDSVNSIPQSLGQELMKLLVPRADDETRSKTERIRDMHSIENLSTRFPTNIDLNKLEHQKLEIGSGVQRLKHILNQNLCGETVDNDVAISWILEGLSSFLTEEVDDKVHTILNTISHDLAERPVQVALTDWASEVGRRETKQPKFERLDKYPIFKSVANGNLPELQHLLAKTKTHPSKLRYEQYDLLNFSIVAKQPKICRYLCLEHDFEFTLKDGGEDAFEACISDPLITALGEFDSFSALLHQKWLNKTGGDIDKKPTNLGLTLLYPPCFAILVREGTAMAIESTHSLVSSPLAFTEKMTQLMWIEQFEGEDELNPLLSALSTRRLTPFMRVLQMGSPHRANFSPNSVLFGMPILFHAIESLAPFFVVALLAYGADVKATVEIFGMSVGPLHLICTPQCIQGYKESLQRRLKFHEDCGFDERIIKRDRAEIETAEQDAASQRILIADLLISHGADINARMMVEQEKGIAPPTVTIGSLTIPVGPDTPLSLAISSGDTELACFLITKGADLALLSMARHHYIKPLTTIMLR
ncbi:hypothetical protein GQ44DRAFT_435478 [Phaeosphaeriaceae sp. PMI808]|nr:hypothetical protein GQ44DRAFT_435478 [Phaeosphaeriaceae sp. PMI808]